LYGKENNMESTTDYEAEALSAAAQASEDEAHRARAQLDAMVASTWMEVPLGSIIAGDVRPAEPTILRRTDGHALFYAGKTHMLLGAFESGKSTAALAATAETIRGGDHVMYVDFEDDAEAFVLRLRQLGAPDDAIRGRAHYIRPDRRLEGAAIDALRTVGAQHRPTLVVIDGVTEAMTLHGWNPDKMDDVARFYALLPRRIDQTRAAVVMIDHVVKSRDDRGNYAIGSQHKMAGINGAAYKFEPDGALSPGRRGKVVVTVTKDRPGSVRKFAADGKRIGTMHLRPVPERGPYALDVTIEPPSFEEDRGRFDDLMAGVAAWLGEHDEPVSQNAVEGANLGTAADVRNALAALVDGGYAEQTPGPRRSKLHKLVRPYVTSSSSPS
jgi:hypothetical protein